ncbi:hypothetical protein L7F22_007293 [Adiantum nelumboides]|nr:hypothetical protein [Adiantum nelumboides]
MGQAPSGQSGRPGGNNDKNKVSLPPGIACIGPGEPFVDVSSSPLAEGPAEEVGAAAADTSRQEEEKGTRRLDKAAGCAPQHAMQAQAAQDGAHQRPPPSRGRRPASSQGHGIVGVLSDDTDPMVSVMKLDKAPAESYEDVGGLEQQIQEIKESVELPLTHPELYEEMGIKPPKGVILYGVPGTGKTLLAKAVANQTSATFLRVVGSELIQKYLGDGPKLVRELFRVAEEHAPSIVFIDEIDAIGTKRYDSSSGGEREIQRTLLELLNQLDGFDTRHDVKVIMATNKIESLDPALIRPGRIDRKIEFPCQTKRPRCEHIFRLHTSRMNLDEDVKLEEFVAMKDELSGADIKSLVTEAGLLALRERRMRVTKKDFTTARERVIDRKQGSEPAGLYL